MAGAARDGSLLLLAEDRVDDGDDGCVRFFVHRRIRSCQYLVAVVDAVAVGIGAVRPGAELEFRQIGQFVSIVGPEYSRRLRKIAMMETVDSREFENVAGFG